MNYYYSIIATVVTLHLPSSSLICTWYTFIDEFTFVCFIIVFRHDSQFLALSSAVSLTRCTRHTLKTHDDGARESCPGGVGGFFFYKYISFSEKSQRVAESIVSLFIKKKCLISIATETTLLSSRVCRVPIPMDPRPRQTPAFSFFNISRRSTRVSRR